MRATKTTPVRSLNRTMPKPIALVLARLDQRVRLSSLVRGLGTTALVVSLVAALGMIADFLWALPQALRWGSWAAALAAVLFAFGWSVVRASLRRRNAFDLAAAVEHAHPGMEENLTGAVALLSGGNPSHGSAALIAAVADRAAERVGLVEPARVIPWRGPRTRFLLGLAALGVLAAPLLFWPVTYTRLARHFLMPWADVERPGRLVVAVSPGNHAIPVGADLAVTASVRTRLSMDSVPEDAWLVWSTEGEQASHRVAMPGVKRNELAIGSAPAKPSRDYAVTLPRLARSISYRVESGSVQSPRYRVKVVEPPSLAAISVRVDPPAYTKLPATPSADATRIEAFEGSKVTLDIKASSEVGSIEIDWPVGTAESPKAASVRFAAKLSNSGRAGSLEFKATRSGSFAVWLRDESGIVSRPDQPRRLIVRPDAAPSLAVRGPEDGIRVSSTDTLSLAIAARDDIAVASSELHYTIERSEAYGSDPETGHEAVALEGLGSRSARGSASFALERLGLKPGDSLSFRVRVADNRPAPRGPNVVWSTPQTLAIVAAAVPLRLQASRARTSGVRTKLETLKREVIADREKTEKLRQQADAVRRGAEEWDETRREALAEREAATRAIEDQLKVFAHELDADPATRNLSRAAQQVAAVEAEAARSGLDQARREVDPVARHSGLERAVGRLAAVNERLDDLTHKLDLAAREQAEVNRLGELARRRKSWRLPPEPPPATAPKETVWKPSNSPCGTSSTPCYGRRRRCVDWCSRGSYARPSGWQAARALWPRRSVRKLAAPAYRLRIGRPWASLPGSSAIWKTMPASWASRSIRRFRRTVETARTRREFARRSSRSSGETSRAAASNSSVAKKSCDGWPATLRTCRTTPSRLPSGCCAARRP